MAPEDYPCVYGGDLTRYQMHMNWGERLMGVGLTVGIIAATIPQSINIYKKRTSKGLSWLTFFLAVMNQFNVALNSVIFKWNQMRLCSVVGFLNCFDSVLAGIQLLVVCSTYLPILPLYLRFFPHGDKDTDQSDFRQAKFFFGAACMYMFLCTCGALGYMHIYGPCDTYLALFGDLLGDIATIMNIVQWLPQILHTFKLKSKGSLSMFMFCITGPGAFLSLYFLAVVSKEPFSTWISYLTSGIQQTIILCQLVWYEKIKCKFSKSPVLQEAEKTPLLPPVSDRLAA